MNWLLQLLEALKEPVLLPAIISGLTWAIGRYTTLLTRLHNDWAVRAIMIAVGAAIGFVGQRFGIDVSSVSGAAASAVAILIYHIGKAKA